MQKQGFSKTIIDDDNKEFHLPTAEYIKECDCDVEKVLSFANNAASKTKVKYSIIAVEYVDFLGYQLNPVEK
ncbi:hypothetical protein GGR06_004214 [Bacteroides reticulotermitis]|uniref:Uncharacterized protein n=3 Tax=Bacteroides reticulotermitis TaxID=1133319 RepID=W4V0C2_9BACE|nr:hypothetical protein [Bacteroides reticulotermitis]MBB4046380.1 hypothetical protein [Bacteroides reticulotermitis]GAE86681.1 hypothetical protein JCM10512_5221 [Bacteroides reticulotermitis JCM 10512]